MVIELLKNAKMPAAYFCRVCCQVVWSASRHDFASCSCYKVFVDGGYAYKKVTANPSDMETIIWLTPIELMDETHANSP